MPNKTSIEWTSTVDADGTHRAGLSSNPLYWRRKDNGQRGWHCEKVSPGCINCYAERLNLGKLGNKLPFTVRATEQMTLHLSLGELASWSRLTKPNKIFVCNMTDIFADFVSDEDLRDIFLAMEMAHKQTFLVLTKRAQRMRDWVSDWWAIPDDLSEKARELGLPAPNIWLGVSAENQEWADKRIPLLLRTPAAKRFVSAEPLLGPIDLWDYLHNANTHVWCPAHGSQPGLHLEDPRTCGCGYVDWCITGGESGSEPRPCNLDWVRHLRDQCLEVNTAFFHKQAGGKSKIDGAWGGRTLDGRKWSEFPK